MKGADLLSGHPKYKYFAVQFLGIRLFRYEESTDSVFFVEGAGNKVSIKNREKYLLCTEGKRPLFGKGFRVLALKNRYLQLPEPNTTFIPAVVNSWKKEKGRKLYNLTFDDGTTDYVYEELIIPPREYWNNRKKVYYVEGNKPVDAPREGDSNSSDSDSDSSESDSNSSSSDSESSSSKSHRKHNKKSRMHKKVVKHNHHNHSKTNRKRRNAPQIVIIPIFVPYYYGM